MRRFLLLLILLNISNIALSQLSNDDCLSALFIDDISDYCSPPNTFTNVGALPSGFPEVDCWRDEDNEADVWYSFIPSQTAVFIQLFGEAPTTTETLNNSAIALYQGTCDNLDEVLCSNIPRELQDIAERTVTDLVIGRVYYLRISSQLADAGTFQLCLTEFTPKKTPESDCRDAVVLCDKSPFFIENLQGVGDLTNEVAGTCINEEFASAWYTWTAENTGTLTFTITPNNVNDPAEDIDFAVFRLPSGLSNCDDKELIRCMASGETEGFPFELNEPCFGATGLRDGESDTEESPGCNVGDNNFLAPLNMIEGESYALVVNNFSLSGFGFNIEFGGTGNFLGPQPQFEIVANDGLECDKTISFTDNTLNNGDSIVSYTWNFGEGANPLTLDGIGPHEVVYESFGEKRVALIVETLRGCVNTEILNVSVAACCNDTSTLQIQSNNIDLICNGVPEGSIEGLASGGLPEYSYQLNDLGFQPSPQFNDLSAGQYTLEAIDRKGCTSSIDVTLTEPPPLEVIVSDDDSVDLGFSIQLNSMFGPDDRVISYEWGPSRGLSCSDCPDPLATPPGTTTYVLTITDQDGCTATDEVILSTALIRPIEVPNIISLNPINSENSFLWISGNEAVQSIKRFRVYDRWGNLMYQVSDVPLNEATFQGWDGTFKGNKVNNGVYVWMAEITFVDDVTLPYHGDITVIQ